jgi:hypothetical protein
MTELARWVDQNDFYLEASLAWLRLRLLRQAAASKSDSKPCASGQLSDASTCGSERASLDESLALAAAERGRAAAVEPPPALIILGQRLGLSDFEQDLVLLCSAMEFDTRIPGLCACAQNDAERPFPTFGLALAMLQDPAWDAITPGRPLRRWHLVEIEQAGDGSLLTSRLRADERIVHFLKGLNRLDDRLAAILVPLPATSERNPCLPQGQTALIEAIRQQIELAVASGHRLPIVHLLGHGTESKWLVAQRVAATLGLDLYSLPVEALPGQATELDAMARLVQREAWLLPMGLYLDVRVLEDIDRSMAPASSTLARFLERMEGLVFLDSDAMRPRLRRSCAAHEIPRPTATEQVDAWADAIGPDASDLPDVLAGQFDLELSAIRQVVHEARGKGPTDAKTLLHLLWQACLAMTRPALEGVAERLRPRATWEDLVLPESETESLRRIADQVRWRIRVYDTWGFRSKQSRGLGIAALFSGESGTGKTMAAEVLANELELDLFRIDLAGVVSKYIGETEKNLRRLFDAAEAGGAILFFDEADALFGRRSEVKDSHDRYANIEIDYLLQRMESFRGLAILATNQKSALDPAFLRRLRFIITFPFPGPVERLAIWSRAFPAETPTACLEFERLSRLNLTGGSIHNVALGAAFLAAQRGTEVTMPLVLSALRAEYRKLDRPIPEAEFRCLAAEKGDE